MVRIEDESLLVSQTYLASPFVALWKHHDHSESLPVSHSLQLIFPLECMSQTKLRARTTQIEVAHSARGCSSNSLIARKHDETCESFEPEIMILSQI